jgi:hypothetical protein
MAQTTRIDQRKCLLGLRMMTKYIQGVCEAKNRPFFQPSREIPNGLTRVGARNSLALTLEK